MTWHRSLPWKFFIRLYRQFRREYFRKERPEGKYFVITPEEVSRVEPVLGDESYAPNWEQSYYKRGEDLNLSRVYYEEREACGKIYDWWQTHVRGWLHDDGSLWLQPHDELEPTENPKGHLEGIGYNKERGFRDLIFDLEKNDFSYKVLKWERK